MDNIIVSDNNNAFVPNEQSSSVHEQAPVLIQENILQDGGIAATIDVGSTTTLEPSSPAYVRNVGDEKHAVLQFGIPKGETGQNGTDGVDGSAATIQIGSVETVDSSADANVVNVGTENAAVLNFSIPRGEQGIQGEQGYSPVAYVSPIQGGARIHIADSQTETDVDVMDGQDGAAGQAATITVGSTTTGAAGTNASVVNSGTSSAAVFDFTIPRGADGQDGQDGQDGADGQAATITVGSTTTGAAGTNASVVNSGTSSAAVLDFTIPRGADGQNGQDGTDGTDGFSPIATVSQGTGSATISITDANGTTTATVYDGATGPSGVVYTTLFSGSGTGDVNLNASAANFDYIEIYGTELGGRPLYLKLPTPVLNVKFSYGISFYASGVLYTRTRTYTFTSNTKISSTVDSEQIEIRTSGTTMLSSGSITITKVVGIKVS